MRAALAALKPGARILDVACGIGVDAEALARRGFRVTAADGSADMLAVARDRLRESGTIATLVQSNWTELEHHVQPGAFDAVLCVGNSLAHAVDESAMVAAFRSWRRLLVPEGRVVVDSHDWEAIRAAGSRSVVDPVVAVRGGVRCQRTYVWRVPPALSAPHELEFRLALSNGEQAIERSHAVTLHPFTPTQLRSRLAQAGLRTLFIDAGRTGSDRYAAVAGLAPRGPTATRTSTQGAASALRSRDRASPRSAEPPPGRPPPG